MNRYAVVCESSNAASNDNNVVAGHMGRTNEKPERDTLKAAVIGNYSLGIIAQGRVCYVLLNLTF